MPTGVRGLYRRILLLHRALPAALRALGDRYVKEEFKKHRAAGPAAARRFLREWEGRLCLETHQKVFKGGYKEGKLCCSGIVVVQNYAALIEQQINEDKQNLKEKTEYGIQLTEEKLNDFRDEQIGQLKELMDEATKPKKKVTVSEDFEQKI